MCDVLVSASRGSLLETQLMSITVTDVLESAPTPFARVEPLAFVGSSELVHDAHDLLTGLFPADHLQILDLPVVI